MSDCPSDREPRPDVFRRNFMGFVHPLNYHRRMAKTQKEIEEHQHRAIKIANQLADEYGSWHGWTMGFGRNVALGEYIVEQVDSGLYEPWMVEAKTAYLKWRKEHPEVQTTPPPNRKA